jgi:two-component system sensor kinase FixL
VIVIAQRRDVATFPVELTITAVAGERLFTGAIRDLTLIVKRDSHRRKLEAALLRTVKIGELNHLTSKLANRMTSRLAAVHDDFATGQWPPHGLDRDDVWLAIGEHTPEVIRKLRTIAKPAIAETRVESLWDIIEVASGLALARVQQPLTLKIRVAVDAAEAVVDRNQIQQVLRNSIRDAVGATAGSARRELTIATTRAGDMVEVRIADTTTGLAEDNSADDGADGGTVFRVALPRPVAWSPEPEGRYSSA